MIKAVICPELYKRKHRHRLEQPCPPGLFLPVSQITLKHFQQEKKPKTQNLDPDGHQPCKQHTVGWHCRCATVSVCRRTLKITLWKRERFSPSCSRASHFSFTPPPRPSPVLSPLRLGSKVSPTDLKKHHSLEQEASSPPGQAGTGLPPAPLEVTTAVLGEAALAQTSQPFHAGFFTQTQISP